MDSSVSSSSPLVDDFQMTCRFSNHGDFSPESFDSISCSACFYFIFMIMKPYSEKYYTELCEDTSGVLICPVNSNFSECHCGNSSHVYNIPNFALNASRTTPLYRLQLDPPLPVDFEVDVQECCSAARNCCRNTLVKYSHNNDYTCPATWDGWNCFDVANPGRVARQCPDYIYGGHGHKMDGGGFAHQECTKMGWAKLEQNGQIGPKREHTDYSGCSSSDAHAKLLAGVMTYSISVVFVVPAVFMLSLLRPIRCQPMFILHRHLLLSCLAYGAFYLINVALFVADDAPLSSQTYSNHIFCRVMFSVQLRYLRLTNFSWMLAEAVYLYRLLYTAQHSEGETLKDYKLICWGVPGLITFVYMFLRGFNDDVGFCWIENSSVAWVEWMIFAPSLLAMGVNLLLLGLIVFILLKKLRCDPHLERIQYRKAVRGALMLIPVFGVQQLLTIYRFNNTVYQVTDISLNGLQGLFVAFIVCYTNRSVLEGISKFWNSHQEKRALGAECRQRMSIQENGKLLLKSSQPTEHVIL